VKRAISILFVLVLVVGLGLIITVPVVAEPGTTYYVSAAGDDDTGDGTVGNPWRTIQKAIDALNFTGDGDTIMVGAGEYDAFAAVEKANMNIISTEGATVTTADTHWILAELGVGYDLWGMAVVVDSENINIQGINFDGTAISEEGIFGIAYFDSTGRIAGLTVENLIGTVGVGAGVVIIDDSGLSDVEITGSNISDNEVGIMVYTDWAHEIHFNNIVNNDYGVVNEGGETPDATYNWWGDASGPFHPTDNPGGSGNPVSDNVDFEPWLEAESVTETVENDTFNAIDEADMEVVVDGTATLTIARYASNPHPDEPTGGEGELASLDLLVEEPYEELEDLFRDIYVIDYEPGTEIEIRLYYTDAEANDFIEAELRLFWWNDTDWVKCSPTSGDSGVNMTDIIINGNDYSGYMWAIIRENGTTPVLGALDGDEFGGYGHPSEPGGGCGMATLADVTPFALVSVGIVAVWATKRKGKVS